MASLTSKLQDHVTSAKEDQKNVQVGSSRQTIRKGYVDTPGGQVHYHRCGAEDAQPLILLHQWPEAATQWDSMLPVLAAKGFLAIALDMPIFGESYVPDEEPNFAELAEGVLAAVQSLGYRGPVDYVGHHTGSGVAMWLAAHHPDSVRRLVLWGVPVLPPNAIEHWRNEAPPVFDDEGETIASSWKSAKRFNPSLNTEKRLDYLIARLQMKEKAVFWHHAVAAVDFKELATQVRKPALVLASDQEVLSTATRESVALFPDAAYEDIPGAHMDVANSHPNEFAEAIARFLMSSHAVEQKERK